MMVNQKKLFLSSAAPHKKQTGHRKIRRVNEKSNGSSKNQTGTYILYQTGIFVHTDRHIFYQTGIFVHTDRHKQALKPWLNPALNPSL
jgi:hypothetical protein